MLVLGIESSCDETAAALVEDGRLIRSSVVASQDDIHGKYGGVVPELASRKHIVSILEVIEGALSRSGAGIEDVDGIAVTRGPGLIGSLLVGLSTAKAIGYARKIPFVGVHHIEGHITVALLDAKADDFPLVGLVASGGHTSLYRVPERGRYELISQSLDDAAGEAFDKVAKIAGLGYPGGAAIDRAAEGGNPRAIQFPRPALHTLDFSFSGLKTAVALWVRDHGVPTGKALSDLAASFQEAVVDVLASKLFEAADREGAGCVAVCGGVARNSRFRKRLADEISRKKLRIHLAPLDLCTDNAAMIAAAGYARLARGEQDDLTLNAVATMPFITR
ncbi:MAG: tRNA (adenosine(37)-N6)-threonylcarbamoyltransferase complex transferase subunit TsaD [Pseudomonadota bacterium]